MDDGQPSTVRRDGRGSLIARVALGAASILLMVLIAEVVLRAVYPVGQMSYRRDPSLLFALRPNSARLFVHHPDDGGSRLISRVNSQGFRGPELQENPSKRIAVYGDSFIQGEFSTYPSTFPAQLQQLLSDSCPGVEVVNAGVRSYGPDQSYIRMEQDFEMLDPDLIVFSVYAGNDYGDLIRKKLFRMTPSGECERRHPALSPIADEEFDETFLDSTAIAGLFRAAKRGFKLRIRAMRGFVRSFSFDGLMERLQAEFEDFERDDIVHAKIFDACHDVDIATAPALPAPQYKRQLMRGIMSKLSVFSREHDVEILVIVIPAYEDMMATFFPDVSPEEAAGLTQAPLYDARRVTEWTVRAAADAGLPVVNLWDAFELKGPRDLYLLYNRHWNDRGQALAGRVVAKTIEGCDSVSVEAR